MDSYHMSKIIILKGPENVGKSTSLRILIGKLLNNPINKLIYPDVENLKNTLEEDADCLAIFELPGGRKVGVITWGDPGYNELIEQCLNRCNKHLCDVIVCASRSYLKHGSVFEVLYNEGSKPGNLLVVTTPFIVHNLPVDITKDFAPKFLKPYNASCADSIFELIQNS